MDLTTNSKTSLPHSHATTKEAHRVLDVCRCGGGSLRLLLLAAAAAGAPAAAAASAGTFISGTAIRAGLRVPGAAVVAAGNSVVQRTHTDAHGRYGFTALPVGTYALTATSGNAQAKATVDLSSSGETVDLVLRELRTIGSTTAVPTTAPPVRGSGTDLTLEPIPPHALAGRRQFP
jgi:hypothetical protein